MKKTTNRIVMALTVGLLAAASAQAEIQIRQDVKNTIPGAVTYDFYASSISNSNANITVMEMILSSPGGIYQNPLGSVTPPTPGLLPAFPDLEFDTFLGLGSLVAGGPAGEPQIAGGAVDIGGASAATFDDSLLDIAWFPAGGLTFAADTPQFVARVTLFDDAEGVFFVRSSGGPNETIQFTIFVPEPSGIALICIGVLGLMRRRISF